MHGVTGLNAYQRGGPVLDKLRSLWEGIRGKADDPSLGYIGASMLPGVGEATDLVEIGAGLQDRSPGRIGLGLAGLALPFVGAAGVRKLLKGRRKLPMDEASRLARAEEMGFDLDVYHGTHSTEGLGRGDWDYLDPNAPQDISLSGIMGPKGTWVARNPEYANEYTVPRLSKERDRQAILAGLMPYRDPGRIYPLKVRSKKILEQDSQEWNDLVEEITGRRDIGPLWMSHMDEVLEGAKRAGWEGIGFDHLNPEGTMMMFDPKNIRSRWAAFDPSKAGSRNLLAGIGGLAGTRYMSNALREDREN